MLFRSIPVMFSIRSNARISDAGLIITSGLNNRVHRHPATNLRDILFIPFRDDWRKYFLTLEMYNICCAD